MLDDKGELRPRRSPITTRCLPRTPDDGSALNGRAWGYAQQGELDKALGDSERAVSLIGDEPERASTPAPGST